MDQVEILLVEDSPSDIKLALHAFRSNQLTERIHIVRDGVEALEFLHCTERYADRRFAQNLKLVLLDLKLPLLGGIEVLRHIKSDERLKSIPVVAMTASLEERDVAESYRLGVNSYIVKPVDFDQFTSTIRQLGEYWLRLNQLPHVE